MLKPWMAHQVRSAVAAKPLADSTPSDHDSPNAPATARSVYVIAHTAARPARLAPRFWCGAVAAFVNCATVTQPLPPCSLEVPAPIGCGLAILCAKGPLVFFSDVEPREIKELMLVHKKSLDKNANE